MWASNIWRPVSKILAVVYVAFYDLSIFSEMHISSGDVYWVLRHMTSTTMPLTQCFLGNKPNLGKLTRRYFCSAVSGCESSVSHPSVFPSSLYCCAARLSHSLPSSCTTWFDGSLESPPKLWTYNITSLWEVESIFLKFETRQYYHVICDKLQSHRLDIVKLKIDCYTRRSHNSMSVETCEIRD